LLCGVVFRGFKPLMTQCRPESHLILQKKICSNIPLTINDYFCQIWDSESTPESYDSFNLRQKNRSCTNSKFKDSCHRALRDGLLAVGRDRDRFFAQMSAVFGRDRVRFRDGKKLSVFFGFFRFFVFFRKAFVALTVMLPYSVW
jgi:hypothetical protein